MEIIIADAGPLQRLAHANALSTLDRRGNRVRMADMTAFEAIQEVDAQNAAELRDWLDTSGNVSIEGTCTGRLFVLARQADPSVRAREAGRVAAIDWLAETVQAAELPAIVIHEDVRVPGIVTRQGRDTSPIVVTTDGFMRLMA